ncbi:hypothetical protein BD309DRAFT_923182 [Dichomitus squalens]|uniref:Fungal-type protein kinase domain-containing protein n=1 Tax=Dichomitus squalens TaxID=114155 RepID=A0A4Q9NPL2_9APHY|nr:hypothetical protein BD309DRAFT_923182 [Dichomitus squalens]TBU56774.1 hypothetical protein BD310DRAFT_882039 [Dichomitus squalens]
MGPRFYLVESDVFSARIPGDAPTEVERSDFESPKLTKGMSEKSIHLQLRKVVRSVLKAAGCKNLRVLDTANHNAKEGNCNKKVFNDAGIYLNTPLTRRAITRAPEHDKESTTKEQLKTHRLGPPSWHWMEVPMVVKANKVDSAFYFKRRPHVEEVEKSTEQDGVESEQTTDALGPESVKKRAEPLLRLSDYRGRESYGHLVNYMDHVFNYQHRTFCYAVYVCFDMARLLYFDRSGAYVTEALSWVETTSLLHELVWKTARLAVTKKFGDMGHDSTATMVDNQTRKRFIKEARNLDLPSHVRAGLAQATESYCPLYMLEVEYVPPSPDEWFPDEPFPFAPEEPTDDAHLDEPLSEPSATLSSSSPMSAKEATPSSDKTVPRVRKFIVGRPHFAGEALVGRCTKGYMAFDVTDPMHWAPCFVKDTWRPYIPNRTRPEHLVYERLLRKGIKPSDGIATFICGGDVGGSRAQWTRIPSDLPGDHGSVPHIHYRVATADIGLPVSQFKTFGELSGLFADALKAHGKVWDLAGVLHRDISVNNIMIRVGQDGQKYGFLIDWELSKVQCELGQGPVKPDRAGTWDFFSTLYLRYPKKPYRRSDDIESFIYAYLYLVLHYHRISAVGLQQQDRSIFKSKAFINGAMVGGDAKWSMMRSGQLPFEIPDNPYLQELLVKILCGCNSCYESINADEMERVYGVFERVTRIKPLKQRVPENAPEDPRRVRRSRFRRLREEGSSGENPYLAIFAKPRPDPPPKSPMEMLEMGSFLSSPDPLRMLLIEHAEKASDLQDKAPDQFHARKHEDCYRPYDLPPDTSGTSTMDDTSGAASSGRSWSEDDSTASSSTGKSKPKAQAPLPSGSSRPKKRALDEDPQDDVTAHDDGEGPLPVRRSKRIKASNGKVPQGPSGEDKCN